MNEEDLKLVNASLKRVGDDLKAFAERSEKEIKRTGEMHAETKAEVDKLLATQTELVAQQREIEQALAGLSRGDHQGKPRSFGELVTSDEDLINWAARAARGGKGSFTVSINAAVVSDQGSGGQIVRPDRAPMVPGTEQRLYIRDLLNWGRTASNSVEYVRETGFTNSAAPVEENPSVDKPESDIQFELASAAVATIAHWIPASKQVLADIPMMQSYIDGRLRYGLKLKEEAQLLKGSGVGLNINGLYTQAVAFANPGVTVTSPTDIDVLRVALLQVQLADYAADGIVLNPIDWANIELTKDSNAQYIFANAQAASGPRLWGLPVVPTKSLSAGEFLTGAFRMGAQGWDREDVSVTVSLEDSDNIRKNMVTLLCEERVALTVYRPESFVKGDFGDSNL